MNTLSEFVKSKINVCLNNETIKCSLQSGDFAFSAVVVMFLFSSEIPAEGLSVAFQTQVALVFCWLA